MQYKKKSVLCYIECVCVLFKCKIRKSSSVKDKGCVMIANLPRSLEVCLEFEIME